MAEKKRCPIIITSDLEGGEYANAFRITQECGGEAFLDFLDYSESRNSAVVVARIRVSGEFLPVIRDHLVESF